MEEWEFGLHRVINFPASRKQSERTYLLKTLAGCPNQREKILRLLNITILEENANFTENDIFLIFSMLSGLKRMSLRISRKIIFFQFLGSSSGYSTLFSFLQENWDAIKIKLMFINCKPNFQLIDFFQQIYKQN